MQHAQRDQWRKRAFHLVAHFDLAEHLGAGYLHRKTVALGTLDCHRGCLRVNLVFYLNAAKASIFPDLDRGISAVFKPECDQAFFQVDGLNDRLGTDAFAPLSSRGINALVYS